MTSPTDRPQIITIQHFCNQINIVFTNLLSKPLSHQISRWLSSRPCPQPNKLFNKRKHCLRSLHKTSKTMFRPPNLLPAAIYLRKRSAKCRGVERRQTCFFITLASVRILRRRRRFVELINLCFICKINVAKAMLICFDRSSAVNRGKNIVSLPAIIDECLGCLMSF